jgi:uridine kinase
MTMKIQITIAGRAGSGKTTLAHRIAAALQDCCAEVVIYDDGGKREVDMSYTDSRLELDTSVEIMTETK